MNSPADEVYRAIRSAAADRVAASRRGKELVRVYGGAIPPGSFPGAFIEHCASLGLPTLEPVAEILSPSSPVRLFVSREGGLSELEGGWEHPFFAGQRAFMTAPLRTGARGSTDHALAGGAFSLLPGFLALLERDRMRAADSLITGTGTARIRGRGGSGYPAEQKWRRFFDAAAAAGVDSAGTPGLIVCNGDEGNPGAYMDRLLLEGDPWSVMEAMLLAGLASGVGYGVIYLRREYVRLYESLLDVCRCTEELGLTGGSILGSGRSFRLEPVLGAGAYICGEETALLRSLEGEIPEPANRPPFPSERGYRGFPTLVHNVESWASITAALRMGAEPYAEAGSADSGGTKLVTLSGDLPVPGMAEVPFGTPVGRILELFSALPGGGGELPAALQTGGPSGGFLSVEEFGTALDYGTMAEAGAPLGSGGIIALDSADKIPFLIRGMLSFSVEESCGKCTPCREGLPMLLEAFISWLSAEKKDPGSGKGEELLDAALSIGDGSFCGLGRGAVRPLVGYLRSRGFSVPGRSGNPGRAVSFRPGRVESLGLPTLCFHKELPAGGACRCCLVEINGEVRSSCDLERVFGGEELTVYPDSDRAVRARRFSLLLAALHDPAGTALGGELEKAGIFPERKESLFPGERLLLETLREQGRRRCILCGRCISACALVPGRHVLTFSGRGASRAVTSAFDLPDDLCIGCGACAFVCPVDAIRIAEL